MNSKLDINIREATQDDIVFLQDSIWEALKNSPALIDRMSEEVLKQKNEEYWQNWQSDREPAFVAENDRQIKVGMLTLRPNLDQTPGESWRIGICVVKEFRRQGIGRKLLEHTVEYSKQTGISYLNLLVDPQNTPAIALYKATGFIDIGIKDGLIAMKKNL